MKIARAAAITRLRDALAKMSESGQCTCRVAADHNIFCQGFAQDTKTELRMRYAHEVDVTGRRDAIEERANEYQLRRTQEEGAELACDVQQRYYETCRGWDEFTNDQLAQFCFELLGDRVKVI